MESEKLINNLLAFLNEQADNIPTQLNNSEWEALLPLADKHGVTPLLYHRLNTGVLKLQVPEDILANLRKAYFRNAFRNARYYQEL